MIDRLILVATDCRIVSRKEVVAARSALKSCKKEVFGHCVNGLLSCMTSQERRCALKVFDLYQLHHIVPLKLGGTNDLSNIALVNPHLHAAVHKIINSQGRITEGETKSILIPKHPRGWRVWGFENVHPR